MITNMDIIARQIAQETADRFDVPMDSLFKPWPRTPIEDAARSALISKLRNMTIDRGRRPARPRYPIAILSEWFGVSRVTLTRSSMKAKSYRPRRQAKTSTGE